MNHRHKHRAFHRAAAFNIEHMSKRTEKGIYLYTIYCNPSDFPGDYVIKKWEIGANEMHQDLSFLKIAKTLEGARTHIPKGSANIGRETDDDPVIVESWV